MLEEIFTSQIDKAYNGIESDWGMPLARAILDTIMESYDTELTDPQPYLNLLDEDDDYYTNSCKREGH